MALAEVSPFTTAQYIHEIDDFPRWVVDYVVKTPINGRTGWNEHFKSYTYSSGGWEQGVIARRDFYKTLVTPPSDDSTLADVANKVVRVWGHIKKVTFSPAHMKPLREAFSLLDNEASWLGVGSTQLGRLFGIATQSPSLPSHTKLYEMHDPHKWTIYDSRVSFALTDLVLLYWTSKGNAIGSQLLSFPESVGRPKGDLKGSQLRDTACAPVGTRSEAALAFIYASWLMREIARLLRQNSRVSPPPTDDTPPQYVPLQTDWQVYHVEMALWMMKDIIASES